MRKLNGQKFIQNFALSFIFIAFTLRFLGTYWEAYIVVGILVLILCVF